VYVAIALDHAESQVSRGENNGRHLVHVAVVTEFTRVGKLETGKSFGQDFRVKLKLPPSCSDESSDCGVCSRVRPRQGARCGVEDRRN
jgi:hypothetical protein